MKWYGAILFVAVMLLSGCGGGGGSSSPDSENSAGNSIDENVTVIELSPQYTDANVTLIGAYDYNASDYSIDTSSGAIRLTLPKRSENIVGRALFIDGIFQGVVAEQIDTASQTTVTLVNADALEDVLESFSIDVDAMNVSNKRTRIKPGRIGRYDAINQQPLSYELRQKPHYNTRTRTTEYEPMMRINFPKGYRLPLHRNPLDIALTASKKRAVDFTGTFIWSSHFDIDEDYEDDYITISSDGSYIEFGLGTRLHVEGKTRRSDRYAYISFDQNATFEANIQVQIDGHYEQSWSDVITLTNDIALIIPISTGINAKIIFTPELRVGGSGRIEGHLSARSFAHRDGAFGISYDSRRSSNKIQTTSSFNTQSDLLNQDGVSVAIEASGSAFLAPILMIEPTVNVLGLADVEFIELRGGIDVVATAHGAINASYEVVNTSEGLSSGSSAEASVGVHLGAFPWISYEMDVEIDPVDINTRYFGTLETAPIVFYDGNENDLYRGNEIEIFDWNIALLPLPEILTTELGGLTYISFVCNVDMSLRDYVRYYYTLDGTTPHEQASMLWDGSAMLLEEETTVKVKAVILGSDYLTSHWSFGKSISPILTQTVEALPPLPAIPTNVNATDSLKGSINVTWAGSIDVATYEIYRSATQEGTFSKAGESTTTSYSDSILLGGSFYYKVKACNVQGYCSDLSSSDQGTALSTVEAIDPNDPKEDLDDGGSGGIEIPVTLSANAGSDQSILFESPSVPATFSASGSLAIGASITGYEWRVTGPNGYVISTSQSFSAYFVAGVYTLELTVTNSQGDTDTDSVVLNVKPLPATPTNVTASSAFNSVHLQWNNVGDVSFYQVYSSASSSGFYDWVAEIPQPSGEIIPLYSTFDHSVNDDKLHFYKIRACDVEIDSCSAFSEIVSAKRNAVLTLQ